MPSRPTDPGPRSPGTSRIVIVVPTAFAWAQRIVQGFTQYAHDHCPDWEVLFAPGHDPLRVTWFGRVDAMVYHGSEEQVTVARQQTLGPVVLVEQPPLKDLASIRTDDRAIAREAFRYLHGQGHTRFAFWGPNRSEYALRRCDSLKMVVRENGCSWLGVPHVPHWHGVEPWNTQALEDWLRSVPKPMALVAATDLTAARVLHACLSAKIRVPDEVSVLGVDDDVLLCQSLSPTLSSVDHNCIAVGVGAAAAIHRWLTRGIRPANLVVRPVGVVERQSTRRLHSNPRIVQALRLIESRSRLGWSAIDIVGHLKVPRRTFELAFRRETGTTLQKAIRDARLRHALQLLPNPAKNLLQIALESGFSSAAYFSRSFRAQTGTTPSEYRRRLKTRAKA
jgi:LacI family transcriptional regulator